MIFILIEQLIRDLKDKLESVKSWNRHSIESLLELLKVIIKNFYTTKTFLISSILLIASISILLRSRMDLGPDTAFYFDLAQRIFFSQGYDQGSSAVVSPLISGFIYAFPSLIASYLAIPLTIIAPIFLVLMAISSLGLFVVILNKTKIVQEKSLYNLLVLIFTITVFLPVFNLEYNEFGVEPSILVWLVLSYFCFYLPKQKLRELSKVDHFIKGCLMAAIVAINPIYILLILIMENVFFDQNRRSFFSQASFYWATVFYLLFIAALFLVYPGSLPKLVPIEITLSSSLQVLFEAKSILVLAVIMVVLIRLGQISELNKVFINLFIATNAVFIALGRDDSQSLSALYSLDIFVLSKFVYDIYKNRLIDWQKPVFNWFLLAFFVTTIFDKTTYDFVIGILVIWPLLVWLFLLPVFKNPLFPRRIKIQITLCLIAALLIMIMWSVYQSIWLGSLLVFAAALVREINDKKYQKTFSNHFSKPITVMVVVVSFYFVSLTWNSLVTAYKMDSPFKSPNQFSRSAHAMINQYAKGERIAVISGWNSNVYPMVFYADIAKYEFARNLLFLFLEKNKKIADKIPDQVVSGLDQEKIWHQDTKLIFIDNNPFFNFDGKSCYISLLEYYLRDRKFFVQFTKNYHFLKRITATREVVAKPLVFGNKEDQKFKDILADQQYLNDFDVYIKK